MTDSLKKEYGSLAAIDSFEEEYIKVMKERDVLEKNMYPAYIEDHKEDVLRMEEYNSYLSSNRAKFIYLREMLYRAGDIDFSSVAGTIAELISAYNGSRYVYKRAEISYSYKDSGQQCTIVSNSVDLIAEEDSILDKYTPEQIQELEKDNKAFVLMQNRNKIKPFNLFDTDVKSRDKVVFIPLLANFEFVHNFFERVVNLNLLTDEDINSSKLRELKDQYLLENLDMLEQRYIIADHNDQEEHEKLVEASQKRLAKRRDFRTQAAWFIKRAKTQNATNVSEE